MTFAENNRISHRQIFRQLILAFTPPFLLCLPGAGNWSGFGGSGGIGGVSGLLGTVAAVGLLLFYVMILIRLAPYYENPKKFFHPIAAGLLILFFLVYVLFAAAFLSALLADVVQRTLLEDVSKMTICALTALACAVGCSRGMQRRGRIAEVSGGIFLFAVLLMMLLCLGQAKGAYLEEMFVQSPFRTEAFLGNTYGVVCAFSGIGLFPFLLGHVEKSGSAWRPAALGLLTVGAILEGMLLLLPAVFGWKRLQMEAMPVLPLLSGADLPGDVLARFDVLWIAAVVYGLLFAIGSLFHYAWQLLIELMPRREKESKKKSLGLAAVVFLLSQITVGGYGIRDYFGPYLAWLFVPGQLVLAFGLLLRGKIKVKKHLSAAMALLLVLFLGGCAGTEPEQRMYPLALGIDKTETDFSISYGMPDLSKITGQEKPEEGEDTSLLEISGRDFAEIQAAYEKTQEKYLDLGHLEIVILGRALLENGGWQDALTYLKEEQNTGEDIYVFYAEDPESVLTWQGVTQTSAGEYLTELVRRAEASGRPCGVTLRDVYYSWYENGTLPELPEAVLQGETMEMIPVSS